VYQQETGEVRLSFGAAGAVTLTCSVAPPPDPCGSPPQAPPNMDASCSGGLWSFTCSPGFQDSDSDLSNGCETALGPELCGDGIDNDGNGQIDEGCMPPFLGEALISEVQTGSLSSTSDEFVEIVNGTCTPIDLTGWRLAYRAANSVSNLWSVPLAGHVLPPGGHLLLGGAGFAAATRDLALAGTMTSSGGGVALIDDDRGKVDSLGWGTATNEFVELIPVSDPPAGMSAARHSKSQSTDTNLNLFDFQIGAPTPENSGSPPADLGCSAQ
jgi:hypothetical protein